MKKIKSIPNDTYALIRIKKATERIIYFTVFLLFFSALIIIACADAIYSDYDTAVYWVKELVTAGKQVAVIGGLFYILTENFI